MQFESYTYRGFLVSFTDCEDDLSVYATAHVRFPDGTQWFEREICVLYLAYLQPSTNGIIEQEIKNSRAVIEHLRNLSTSAYR